MELLKIISDHIDKGDFVEAETLCSDLLLSTNENKEKSKTTTLILFNLAGFFVDLGHMSKRPDLSLTGFDLMTQHQEIFLEIIPQSNVYYNLANAKSNLISEENSFKLTFENIEELVEAKNYFWKALKENQKEGNEHL